MWPAMQKTLNRINRVTQEEVVPSVEASFPYRTDRSDGLRVDFPDRWVLVRASNTEPIVRIIAEAPDACSAQALCDEIRAFIEPE